MNKAPEQAESDTNTQGYAPPPLPNTQAYVNTLSIQQKMTRTSRLRSTLARQQLTQSSTRAEVDDLAKRAWRQRGLALIDPLLISDEAARQALIQEATRLYGRKNDPTFSASHTCASQQEV